MIASAPFACLLAAADSIAPLWVVLPFTLLTMLFLGLHAAALPRVEMPASRRRLRRANTMLMMLAVPLAAYGFGFASPKDHPRLFVLAWMLVAGLVLLILLVAFADIANTWRIHRRERQTLHRELRRVRAQANPAVPTPSAK